MRSLVVLTIPSLAVLLLLAPNVRAETLVVAGEGGVREVGLDGKTLRTISRERASHPRRMPDGKSLLYLVPSKAELRRMDLATGTSIKVAALPRSFRICKQPQQDAEQILQFAELDVHSARDFVLDKSGEAACLELMDRNINMASVIINLRVPLVGGGKVQRAISMPHNCPGPKLPACEPASSAVAVPPAGAYDLEDGWLVAGKKRVVKLGKGDFHTDAVSPGGTWAVISGNIEQGDYIYRSAYLLSRRDGTIRTVGKRGVVLPNKQLRTMDAPSESVVGETPIRWISDEVLLIGSKLVFPGKGLVELSGEVAQ